MSSLIFAIETSCDETAAALVLDGRTEIYSTLATSKDFHYKTGGIVPEIAARKQLESIVPVIEDCLYSSAKKLGVSVKALIKKIDAVAVTVGPGLAGSLVIGVEAAKSLSLAWNKPLIPVNHLVGHIYGNFLTSDSIELPAVALVVSGGHTDLVLMKNHGDLEYLGGTLDDAAGECFDKTARLLGFGDYLGGVVLSDAASKVEKSIYKNILPRSLIKEDNFDFSFSGLKTAVKRFVENNPDYSKPDLAREFEDAVVEVLVFKTIKAAKKYGVKTILVGGGVSANKTLRKELTEQAKDFKVYFPEKYLCTDNAVYIASAAHFNNNPRELNEVQADPSLTILSKV